MSAPPGGNSPHSNQGSPLPPSPAAKSSSRPLPYFLSSQTLVKRPKQRGTGQTSVKQQAEGPGAGSNAGSQGLAHALGLLS